MAKVNFSYGFICFQRSVDAQKCWKAFAQLGYYAEISKVYNRWLDIFEEALTLEIETDASIRASDQTQG